MCSAVFLLYIFVSFKLEGAAGVAADVQIETEEVKVKETEQVKDKDQVKEKDQEKLQVEQGKEKGKGACRLGDDQCVHISFPEHGAVVLVRGYMKHSIQFSTVDCRGAFGQCDIGLVPL